MLRWCRDEPTLKWLHPLLATLAMTGLRIGEAEGLRWSDVDFETEFLRLQDERSSSKKRQR